MLLFRLVTSKYHCIIYESTNIENLFSSASRLGWAPGLGISINSSVVLFPVVGLFHKPGTECSRLKLVYVRRNLSVVNFYSAVL